VPFWPINAEATVPVLDDASALADAVAMCCYLAEIITRRRTARERALRNACNRQLERDGFSAVMEPFAIPCPNARARRCQAPSTPTRSRRWPSAGARASLGFFAHLDRRLAATAVVAADSYSIGDIAAFVSVELAKRVKLPPGCPHPARWAANQSARASVKA